MSCRGLGKTGFFRSVRNPVAAGTTVGAAGCGGGIALGLLKFQLYDFTSTLFINAEVETSQVWSSEGFVRR